MNSLLLWENVVAYSLEIGLLVGVAALVPGLLGLQVPKARIAFWRLLLAACLVLPLVGPWRRTFVVISTPIVQPHVIEMVPVAPTAPAKTHWAPSEIGLAVLAAGAFIRLVWLGVGLWRLGRYRRRSTPWTGPGLPFGPQPEFRLADDVSSPVTFGWREPVVLLPRQFPDLPPALREAILCHESLHVERHDWPVTVAEELVRALFWFHPAIWWLLAEIQLAREQAVDHEVVERTRARDEYLDALLAAAGIRSEMDLAPAPLFLRKRHLKQRVTSILQEVRMSKFRLISAFTMSLATLVAAAWLATAAFPLAAAPQVVADAAGVTVDLNGAQLLHRSAVPYPADAAARGIGGPVVVEVKLAANGSVIDASILSGRDELRKAVLTSVLEWHFARAFGSSTRQVTVTFQAPTTATAGTAAATASAAAPAASSDTATSLPALRASIRVTAPDTAAANQSGTLTSIRVLGLSDQAKSELLAALPVHEGDTVTPELLAQTEAAVKAYDEHLRVSRMYGKDGERSLMIVAPTSALAATGGVLGSILTSSSAASDLSTSTTSKSTVARVRIGSGLQAAMLIYQVKPEYPPLAKQAKISGVVQLHAIISKEGAVQSLAVIPPAHPLLAPAAVEVVKQWRFKPTLLNGEAVEVDTTIEVSFMLADQ